MFSACVFVYLCRPVCSYTNDVHIECVMEQRCHFQTPLILPGNVQLWGGIIMAIHKIHSCSSLSNLLYLKCQIIVQLSGEKKRTFERKCEGKKSADNFLTSGLIRQTGLCPEVNVFNKLSIKCRRTKCPRNVSKPQTTKNKKTQND